jgi:thioredoxin reductase
MAKHSERICIIGGGPAGISAAMYLEKKGYMNYSVY